MMGLGKAIAFGFFAMIPGSILSLIAWVLVGQPETWSSWMAIPCYGPFFGSIAMVCGWVCAENRMWSWSHEESR